MSCETLEKPTSNDDSNPVDTLNNKELWPSSPGSKKKSNSAKRIISKDSLSEEAINYQLLRYDSLTQHISVFLTGIDFDLSLSTAYFDSLNYYENYPKLNTRLDDGIQTDLKYRLKGFQQVCAHMYKVEKAYQDIPGYRDFWNLYRRNTYCILGQDGMALENINQQPDSSIPSVLSSSQKSYIRYVMSVIVKHVFSKTDYERRENGIRPAVLGDLCKPVDQTELNQIIREQKIKQAQELQEGT